MKTLVKNLTPPTPLIAIRVEYSCGPVALAKVRKLDCAPVIPLDGRRRMASRSPAPSLHVNTAALNPNHSE